MEEGRECGHRRASREGQEDSKERWAWDQQGDGRVEIRVRNVSRGGMCGKEKEVEVTDTCYMKRMAVILVYSVGTWNPEVNEEGQGLCDEDGVCRPASNLAVLMCEKQVK